MKKAKIILFLGDIVLLYASLLLMILIRFPGHFSKTTILDHMYPFSVVFLVWLVTFYIWDLYNLSVVGYRVNFLKAMFMNIVAAVVMFYIASTSKMAPKTNLLITAGIFSAFFIGWRSVFFKLLVLSSHDIKVGIIGINAYTGQLLQLLSGNRVQRYSVEYIIPDNGKSGKEWAVIKESLPSETDVYDNLTVLEKERGSSLGVSMVIVSDDIYKNYLEKLYSYIFHGVRVYHIASFLEHYYGAVPVYAASELWLLYNLKEDTKKEFERVKRIEDIILSILGLPVLFALFPFIALGIKITSPGPLIFTQTRVGKNNKHFKIHKFRTMVNNAEKNGAQWAVENDSRITGFGKFLRVTRLDELPQLVNILKGDMSIVGPRPERPEFVENLERKIPHYAIRHFTKPGLTGWAQINAPYASSEEDSAKKLEYDLYYIKNRDLILDIKIILKTVVTVLQRKGR